MTCEFLLLAARFRSHIVMLTSLDAVRRDEKSARDEIAVSASATRSPSGTVERTDGIVTINFELWTRRVVACWASVPLRLKALGE